MASLKALYGRARGAPSSEPEFDLATLFAILGHVVIPLFVLDRSGKVALWNAAVEKLTGLPAAKVLGTKQHWRGFYREERPCLADLVFGGGGAEVTRLYAAHDGAGSDRSRMRAQNWCDLPKGERAYLLIDAGAIYDADGSIRFVVETLQDQTRIKEAEAAIELARDAQALDFERVRETLGAGLDRVAQGDFSAAIESPLPAGAEALRSGFNVAVQGLNALLASVSESAGTLDDGANAIVASTHEATEQSRRQRADLDAAVSALNAITGTVKQNAAGAERARGVVANAKAEAERSGIVVRNAIAAIHEIEKSSKEIGQIIGVIEEIAFQTNLLALNAGVEAARAGELGRGFAVVASEVRALAQRSAGAAKQIKQLVEASDAQVSEGVKLVSGAGAALDSIGGEVARLNDAVGAIVEEATGQAGALQRVDASMTGIGVAMGRTTKIVETSAGAAQDLADEIERLRAVLGRFRIAGERPAARRAAA